MRMLLTAMVCVLVSPCFINAQTITTSNPWQCEDDCIKERDDSVCGDTDHFRTNPPSGGTTTITLSLGSDDFCPMYSGPGDENSEESVGVAIYTPTGELVWNKTVFSTESIEVMDGAEDANGNVIMVGSFKGQAFSDDGDFDELAEGQSDSFVFSYSPSGTLNWAHRIGGPGADDAQRVAVDDQGNITVLGSFQGTVNFNTDPEGDEINLVYVLSSIQPYALKLDGNGNTIWAKRLGDGDLTELNDGDITISVVQTDSDGNTSFGLLTEEEASTLAAENPVFVGGAGASTNVLAGKLNPDGNEIWTTQVTSDQQMRLGGIIPTADGGAYVAGAFESQIAFRIGPEIQFGDAANGKDVFLAKYDSIGILEHARLMDSGLDDDICEGIAQDENGTLYMLYNTALQADADLFCLDPEGNCDNDVKIGLLAFTPAANEADRVAYPVWSTNGKKKEPVMKSDNDVAKAKSRRVTFNVRSSFVNVNTNNGGVNIDSSQSELVYFNMGVDLKGCTDDTACNYDVTATLDDGTCLYSGTCAECGGDGGNCIGCRDTDACNYEPNALVSDECTYPDGCTDEAALNFNSGASCDDGSCIYADQLCGDCTIWDADLGTCIEDPACAAPCFGDSNNDNIINSPDLLAFLAVFGEECE